MAPEYLDDGAITVKSDIYSLGVIIRRIVIGRKTGQTIENVRTNQTLYSLTINSSFVLLINIYRYSKFGGVGWNSIHRGGTRRWKQVTSK